MYGMGGGGISSVGTAVTTTATGAFGVAFLPNTGSLSVMFYIAATYIAIGIVSLLVNGAIKFKKNLSNKAQ